MQTPICMMNGEQFAFLMSNLSIAASKNRQGNDTVQEKPHHLAYGIQGIAETFGCSIPTANRIKRSGIIDDAISQVGRKIVIDANMALKLVADAKRVRKEGLV